MGSDDTLMLMRQNEHVLNTLVTMEEECNHLEESVQGKPLPFTVCRSTEQSAHSSSRGARRAIGERLSPLSIGSGWRGHLPPKLRGSGSASG